MITCKENDLYREIELFSCNIKIGEAEVDLANNMLSRFNIIEPYRNMGYGNEALKMLIEKYNIDCLWVEASNERAIHVYEKNGFKKVKPTMYLMERNNAEK